MKIREYIIVLVLCFAANLFAQDLAGNFGNPIVTPSGAVIPTPTPAPAIPTTENAPGYEGAFVMDANYIYTFHNNVWCKSQRLKF